MSWVTCDLNFKPLEVMLVPTGLCGYLGVVVSFTVPVLEVEEARIENFTDEVYLVFYLVGSVGCIQVICFIIIVHIVVIIIPLLNEGGPSSNV